jgi:uncharacterized membrane protein YgdD (TMEM256/DUF423 family)
MIAPRLFRLLIIAAGLMGAAGVVLAALSAHQADDVSRLAAASSMLLFHASAVIGTVVVAERGLVQPYTGTLAALGFVIGAALFSVDLALRQYAGHSLFPMAAPSGGTLLIVSWLTLALAAGWPRKA